jgi:hypothetical protein
MSPPKIDYRTVSHAPDGVQQSAGGPLLLVLIAREHLVGIGDGILDMGKGSRVEAAF